VIAVRQHILRRLTDACRHGSPTAAPSLESIVRRRPNRFSLIFAHYSQFSRAANAFHRFLDTTQRGIWTTPFGVSGSELLHAAVASLAIVKKKETFARKEINEEIKQATGYYKATYTNNLTGYLDGLTKQGVIIEVSRDTYAVTEQARKEMEQRLAQ
jgi:hypothetical protein